MHAPDLANFELTPDELRWARLASERIERIRKAFFVIEMILICLPWVMPGLIFFEIGWMTYFSVILCIAPFTSEYVLLTIRYGSRRRRVVYRFQRFTEAAEKYVEWLDRTQRDFWFQLSGREFEEEVARLFRRVGFNASLTSASGDRGIDIDLFIDGKRTIVQCKQHKKPIGVAAVREIYGVMRHVKVDKAFLVCPSGFTRGVHEFVFGKPIFLLEMDDLIRMQFAEEGDDVVFRDYIDRLYDGSGRVPPLGSA